MTQETDKKYLERWANMYSLARSIPRDRRFNMNFWGRHDEESACGTTACLAGHAILHPWFRRRGFKTVKFEDGSMYISESHRASFWGNDTTPFFYEAAKTPKQAAEFLKHWMVERWGKSKVESAISKATATYDKKWVHKYAPWECPDPN